MQKGNFSYLKISLFASDDVITFSIKAIINRLLLRFDNVGYKRERALQQYAKLFILIVDQLQLIHNLSKLSKANCLPFRHIYKKV